MPPRHPWAPGEPSAGSAVRKGITWSLPRGAELTVAEAAEKQQRDAEEKARKDKEAQSKKVKEEKANRARKEYNDLKESEKRAKLEEEACALKVYSNKDMSAMTTTKQTKAEKQRLATKSIHRQLTFTPIPGDWKGDEWRMSKEWRAMGKLDQRAYERKKALADKVIDSALGDTLSPHLFVPCDTRARVRLRLPDAARPHGCKPWRPEP